MCKIDYVYSEFYIFILMLAPLFIFDYYHNWSNLLTPYRLASRASHSFQLPQHLVSLGETLGRTLHLDPGTDPSGEIRPGYPDASWTTPSTWLVVLSLLALFIKTGNPYLTFAIFLLTLSYLFYPGPVTGYYALGLIPLYFIQLAKLFTRYRLGYLLILVFAIFSLSTLSSTSETYGYHAKRELIEDVASYLGDNSFSLSEQGTAHKYGGWRYLFTVYGKYPASSSADASLAWLYPQEIGGPSRYHVLVGATKEFEIPSGSLALYQSGGYTAVITYAK